MPALNRPIYAREIRDYIYNRGIVIHGDSVKEGQMIYTVQPLSFNRSFEGVLTFSEGRDFSHVDGGLVITEGVPVSPRFSYISVSFPRVAMAAALGYLFPHWETEEPMVAKSTTVKIGENTSIGHAGFGWTKLRGMWVRFPHIGGVQIGPFTTIGANTTICRGTLSDTIIGSDCHIDDHVHIAHGVVLGNHVIVVANAMIAGSVVVEDDVWIGPSASIMQGVHIGKGATIGMGAIVLRDVAPGETIVGIHRVIPTKDKQIGVTR